jgi:ATP-dependent DNA helicase PIF1
MMSAKILELLEEIARRARKNSSIFGGIQVIFTGDFYQLPPVGDLNEPSTCQFCFESKKWREIFPKKQNLIMLKTIFRQKYPLYCSILNQIRVGELTEENAAILQARVGLVPKEGEIVTRLFPVKRDVEIINRNNFEKIIEKEYRQDCIVKTNCKFYLESGMPFSEEIEEQCMEMSSIDVEMEIKRLVSVISTETFVMKKGTIVMLTFNLCVEDGLCNGSQGIIVDILENQTVSVSKSVSMLFEPISIPVVKFANGTVTRILPHFWQSDEYPRICVGQFPLIMAWALTIHKIQGASLECAQLDAGFSVFEYGQSYVGFSRIRSLDGLYLTNFHPKRIKAHPLVKEFYKNVRNIIPDSELEEATATIETFTDAVTEAISIAEAVNDVDPTLPMATATIVPTVQSHIPLSQLIPTRQLNHSVFVNKLP